MRRALVACVWLASSSIVHGGAVLTLRTAYYRIKTPGDPGCATVLVHNRGDKPVTITQLLMDGSPLPADGIGEGLAPKDGKKADAAIQLAAARIIWARLYTNPVPAGQSSLLYIQYRTRPPYGFQLQLMAGAAVAAKCKLFPVNAPVRMTNIAFPADLSQCLVYLANTSEHKAERIKTVELNGADVTSRIWASSRDIRPGAKELVLFPKPGLQVGDAATVVVSCESGLCIAERVRALPVFPIALEHGGPVPELGIPDVVREWPVTPNGGSRGVATPTQPPKIGPRATCVRIFHCPAHIMRSDWQRCAAEILRRRTMINRLHARLPAYDAVCRARSGLACPSFAHTTDAGFLNPYLPQYSRANPKHPVDAVVRALGMARAANAPDPVYSLVGVYTFGDEKQPPAPDEFDRLVHAIVASGARGLLYRVRRDSLAPRIADRLRQNNEKFKRLRRLLLIAEPMDWASSPNELVKPRVLLGGTDGLLLLLLNYGDKHGRLRRAGPADVTVQLPAWVETLRLAPESDAVDGSVEVTKRQIRVKLNQIASALVLAFRTKQGETETTGRENQE